MAQEAICYLLAEKAREGKTVARLKWGDPFVFDRGGEEALFLHEQGVPFEVVPGLPAGVAVPHTPACPITYPGGGDTVTLVRGHEDEKAHASRIDWASLARLDGTIVCYAGPQQLLHLLEALTANGWPPDSQAAIIYRGTLPRPGDDPRYGQRAAGRHARTSTPQGSSDSRHGPRDRVA